MIVDCNPENCTKRKQFDHFHIEAQSQLVDQSFEQEHPARARSWLAWLQCVEAALWTDPHIKAANRSFLIAFINRMTTPPGEITKDQWAVLRTLYSSADDIDLYVAGQVITDLSDASLVGVNLFALFYVPCMTYQYDPFLNISGLYLKLHNHPLPGREPSWGWTDWSNIQLYQSIAVQEADGWGQVFLHSQEPNRQLYSQATRGNQEKVKFSSNYKSLKCFQAFE